MSVKDEVFKQLYEASDDPWELRQRWYEQRKRALLMACLPRPLYGYAFEAGCANGETSALLAQRCKRLLCCDTAERAVALTREKLGDAAHVHIQQRRLPEQWPQQQFDLIVLNEVGYYLDSDDLARLITLCRRSLTDDGQIVACHWRTPIDGCTLDGDTVHRQLADGLQLPTLLEHSEKDFLLQLWSCDPQSVAEHEDLD